MNWTPKKVIFLYYNSCIAEASHIRVHVDFFLSVKFATSLLASLARENKKIV